MRVILVLILLLSSYSVKAQFVVNEIMASPNPDEPEWVELYNPSELTVLVQKVTLSDLKKEVPIPDFLLYPKSFAILLKDSIKFTAKRSVPDGIPIIVINLPGLNNTQDAVVIKDSTGVVIDSVYYDMAWGSKGKSLERIAHDVEAISELNIAESKDPSGATPGLINSVTQKEYRVEIIGLNQNSEELIVTVLNSGIEDIAELSYKVDIKFENMSYYQKSHEGSITEFTSQKLHEFSLDLTEWLAEEFAVDSLKLTVYFEEEPDNIISQEIALFSVLKDELVINEIMYDISDGNSEYIEIRFTDLSKNSIKGLKIYDRTTWGNEKPIILPDVISLHDYIVISMDSSIYNRFNYLEDSGIVIIPDKSVTLNNGGDLIVITDMFGNVVDSLTYADNWHDPALNETKDRSIIRISPDSPNSRENWTSCPDEIGGNPGLKNLTDTHVEDETIIEVNPNPFSSINSNCTIKYTLHTGTSIVTARIYTLNGIMINEIANNVYTSGVGEFQWDGKDSSGNRLAPGPYVIVLTATSTLSQNSIVGKSVIVIGE